MTRPLPDRSMLLSALEYNASTGELFRRFRPDKPKRWNTQHAGRLAGGHSGGRGVISLHFDGAYYQAHRIIWKMVFGDEPPLVDHVDGNPSNNRIENLRAATASQNCWNSRRRSRKRHLPKGVHIDPRGPYIYAAICKDRRQINLGLFETVEAAHAAYCAAARELHGEFARFD